MAGYQYQIPNGIYSANGSLIIIFRISRYVVDIIKVGSINSTYEDNER